MALLLTTPCRIGLLDSPDIVLLIKWKWNFHWVRKGEFCSPVFWTRADLWGFRAQR